MAKSDPATIILLGKGHLNSPHPPPAPRPHKKKKEMASIHDLLETK